jgi:hypothetical protein
MSNDAIPTDPLARALYYKRLETPNAPMIGPPTPTPPADAEALIAAIDTATARRDWPTVLALVTRVLARHP